MTTMPVAGADRGGWSYVVNLPGVVFIRYPDGRTTFTRRVDLIPSSPCFIHSRAPKQDCDACGYIERGYLPEPTAPTPAEPTK